MKEVNKGILDNDMVISAENIQKIGEIIALTCIKTVIVRAGKELNHLYVRLIDDINHSKNSTRPFSDAYDIAQEAMLFLCEHIGKKLGDDYTVVDGLISKMNLTAAEYETLCAYMAGLTYLEVTRLLNVNRTTIWRRRMSLQRKYALATNSL